jgi:hypothetical protein
LVLHQAGVGRVPDKLHHYTVACYCADCIIVLVWSGPCNRCHLQATRAVRLQHCCVSAEPAGVQRHLVADLLQGSRCLWSRAGHDGCDGASPGSAVCPDIISRVRVRLNCQGACRGSGVSQVLLVGLMDTCALLLVATFMFMLPITAKVAI